MTFGDNLKKIAKSKDISMYKLSKDSGVSQSYISELVSGKQNNPTMDIAKKLARTLNVSIDELINWII